MIHEGWERFYIPEPNSGCWLWTGTLHPDGNYGIKGMYKAHKLFYEMMFGPVPDGLCVCHTCDVPCCVNPDHLWLGTHLENMRDKARKGRVANQFGAANSNARLAPAQVDSIRASTKSHYALSREFGIDREQIRRIRLGYSWPVQDHSGRAVLGQEVVRTASQSRLTAEQVIAILESTESQQVLADRYGVSQGHISNIKRGQRWVNRRVK